MAEKQGEKKTNERPEQGEKRKATGSPMEDPACASEKRA